MIGGTANAHVPRMFGVMTQFENHAYYVWRDAFINEQPHS
jgi:hypothetical protein